MAGVELPDDCCKQWEILLLLISSEEKKIDRTSEGEIETMFYFFRNEGIGRILQQWLHEMELTFNRKISDLDITFKCDDISYLWRQTGNDKFRANKFDECYDCYNKSVIYAQIGGPMYPLALANRSAALLKLKRFKDCLADVARALSEGYPPEQRHKLLLRRADCHIEVGTKAEAKAALDGAVRLASMLNLNSELANEFERNVKLLQQKMDVMEEDRPQYVEVLPECYKGMNDEYNAASNVVELRRSDTAGRHVVVKDDEEARRGDVLFTEEPYAWVTLPSDDPICDGCCRGQINPIPCYDCSRSLYCSDDCRIRSAESFHRWECPGSRLELFSTIGIAHLALRALLISAHDGFPTVPVDEESPHRRPTAARLFRGYAQADDIEIYQKGQLPFFRMFKLVTNFEKMNNTDYIQYAVTATMLTIYLEKFTSFFEYLPTRVPYALSESQLRLFAGALLLRNLGQLICNGHATLSLGIIQENVDDSRVVTEREVRRATAIYPSAAMMNHSCDPNIVNTFYNNRLIVRCSRELSAGDEVVNCYGPHRAREPTQDRRAQLKAQYMFTCMCDACIDAERGDFVLSFSAYLCQTCKGPVVSSNRRYHCQQCQTDVNLESVQAILGRADELFAQAERASLPEERCEKAQCALRLKQQVLHRHHINLRETADGVARIYAGIGEFGKSVEIIKQNVQSLEYQFGSFSVEVAQELRKLSDVMLARLLRSPPSPEYGDWCMETYKIIKKAVQLMELNYGSWEPVVKNLREQENFVAAAVADFQTHSYTENVQRNLHYNLKI